MYQFGLVHLFTPLSSFLSTLTCDTTRPIRQEPHGYVVYDIGIDIRIVKYRHIYDKSLVGVCHSALFHATWSDEMEKVTVELATHEIQGLITWYKRQIKLMKELQIPSKEIKCAEARIKELSTLLPSSR